METLVRVKAPHFCAGLVFEGQLCVEAAPILGWARGKRWGYVRGYFERKGYEVLVLDGEQWRKPRPR